MHTVFTESLLSQSITFDSYLTLTKNIVEHRPDSGLYSTEKMHRYTASNLERMQLVLDKMVIHQKLYNALTTLSEKWIWIVLSEPWCGDASWGTTALYTISTITDHIEFKILLRDSFPEVMKKYQTKGGDAIPKLICLRQRDGRELGTWGPRPAALQVLIDEARGKPDFDFKESVRAVHVWYQADMTNSIQDEFIDLIKHWKTIP